MIKPGDKMIFLTGFPTGILIPVEIIEKHPRIEDGWYIRKPNGTDTTTESFLFKIPNSLEHKEQKVRKPRAELSPAILDLTRST